MERNREVDFHVYNPLTGKSSLVQVSWDMSDDRTFARELTALRDARAMTGIDDCTIVTWDNERVLDDGLHIVPAWQWCLAQEQAD